MANQQSAAAFGGDIGEQRFSEAFDRYKQHIAWVGVAIIVLGIGAWFYVRSQTLKSERAYTAYSAAVQNVAAGNIPLAESDLKKAASRYSGTAGGTEAAMALAKIYYQQGKYQPGVDALKDAASNKGDLQFEALLLQGAGYEGLNKWSDAAKTAEKAASIARFDGDRASAQAVAARDYELGGDRASAVRLWTVLLNDKIGGFANEAKVRLGELEAQPLKS
jgi:lipopolysaccharide biosynthesis regulator YciM